MLYDVYYDIDCNEGLYFETFDNFNDALKFAEKQVESRIVGYYQVVPVSYNINLLYK